MPLLQLWTSSPDAVGQFTIEQVVTTAGDGVLKDGSICSHEFRSYVSEVSTDKIDSYVEQCLASAFARGGMVLRDLINELGRRLDYKVTHGRYQGKANSIGFDGIWRSPEGHSIVVEVKTTDAYRISLETIAAYRNKLIADGTIVDTSSMLIVVGRQDTGDLEAQVRGSRHAWDVRLISAEALLKLVRLRQTAEGLETGRKIRSLLVPSEYTRLDGMIDVMFTAAKEVEEGAVEIATIDQDQADSAVIEQSGSGFVGQQSKFQFTDAALIQKKRSEIISSLSLKFGEKFEKQSRALYGNVGGTVRVACTLSKRYQGRTYPYWYAYHPSWDEYLGRVGTGLLALGCMDLDQAFAIPRGVILPRLAGLNVSVRPDGAKYWHIHLTENGGQFYLLLPKTSESIVLTPFAVRLSS